MTLPNPGQPLRVESLCDTGQAGLGARLTGLPTPVRLLHREVLRAFLSTGQPPYRDDLAVSGGVDRDDAFGQLADLDVVHLGADGRVLVAYPFSGRPTGHTVQLDSADSAGGAGGPVLHAMCAIDALGIPLMTGRNGVITSADPGGGHPVRVERRGQDWRWAPEDTAVLLAQQSSGCGAAADCLCPTITFHTSRRRAEDHLRTRPGLTGVVLDQAQAVETARRSFAHLLDPTPQAVHPRAETGHPRAEAPAATTQRVSVEMLHTEGCPNATDYLPRLRQLAAAAGVTEPVLVRLVADPEQAQRERFLGSPTIRIDGHDVDPGAAARRDYGLSCRLYTGPDGLRGTPPDEWVLALLRPDTTDGPTTEGHSR
ncbi:alkylmercury lyase family protein [Pseudonocardia alni]|jgi:alkylmercury lyase|uniref:Alkylmercury lyase-like protein n=1 Tax=Pseudonocardia alni TaxID=33907 RepID=A0AA44UVB3_PSEA5|nr:alkylmercury lyase family protein [Pseudonocardia alni]PKB41206.1 alkylmercury lyase-like protein [Pseudonocardia alni]